MTYLAPDDFVLDHSGSVADRFGTLHSSRSPAALASFGEAVAEIAAHRPGAGAALGRALEADPFMPCGHALRGFANVILARPETMLLAREARTAARAAMARQDCPTGDKSALVAALDHAADGHLLAASHILEGRLREAPFSLLLIKLAYSLRFMVGDLAGMRRLTNAALATWTPETPGYGFVLGCHAFTLGEAGDLAGAERAGREAVAREPADAWGLHAVAHVYEMSTDPASGAAWIEAHRPAWTVCNNFSFHMAWHLALFRLEQGRIDAALALYDHEVRPHPTDDFRDVANAVSLLWRLEQEGVDVGGRWSELVEIAHRRRRETTLLFAALHHLLALLAAGDHNAAAESAAEIARTASEGSGDQARVAASVGAPLARALLGLGAGEAGRLAGELTRLGGSHAQRDLFLRALALRAFGEGQRKAAHAVLNLRERLRREDRFAMRLKAALGGRSESRKLPVA